MQVEIFALGMRKVKDKVSAVGVEVRENGKVNYDMSVSEIVDREINPTLTHWYAYKRGVEIAEMYVTSFETAQEKLNLVMFMPTSHRDVVERRHTNYKWLKPALDEERWFIRKVSMLMSRLYPKLQEPFLIDVNEFVEAERLAYGAILFWKDPFQNGRKYDKNKHLPQAFKYR